MNIDTLFPSILLTEQCPEDKFLAIRKEIEINFDKINNLLTEDTWGDNVHTTNIKCKCLITELNLSVTKEFITPYVTEFLKLHENLKNCNFLLKDSWINVTGQYGYQNLHVHNPHFVSGVLYLDTPENSGNFNCVPNFIEAYKGIHSITPNNGLLVLFHGTLPHRVEYNKTSKNRISLAFNFQYF